jgi:hypothetical protein
MLEIDPGEFLISERRYSMPYLEAIERGIPVKRGKRGFDLYYPPCHICGTSVLSWSYSSKKVYTCNVCKINKNNRKPLTPKNA